MQLEEMFSLMFVMSMFAGVFVIFMAMRQRSSVLEMQHRERMAMIERGLTPDAERRPVTGDAGPVLRDRATFASRSVTFGIVLIGLGFGFMSIVGIAAGAPEVGIGIGGAFCIVGAAFIVNGVLSKGPKPPVYESSRYSPAPPKPPVDPTL
jgi:hypothetical protein